MPNIMRVDYQHNKTFFLGVLFLPGEVFSIKWKKKPEYRSIREGFKDKGFIFAPLTFPSTQDRPGQLAIILVFSKFWKGLLPIRQ